MASKAGKKGLTVRARITLVGVLSVLVTALVLTVISQVQVDVVSARAKQETDQVIDANLNQIVNGMYNLVSAWDESVQEKVDASLNVARAELYRYGEVSFAQDDIAWTAVNQYTLKADEVTLPKMMVGDTWLQQSTSMDIEIPVVDRVKRLVGGTATVFQRMNAEGDMLRVATNVQKKDGTHAVGTYIPATNPDGTPNPVLSQVLEGKTYRGIAYVVDDWYVSAYEPIYDAKSEIVGVLYVGVRRDVTGVLRDTMMNTQVGKSGYIWIVGAKGSDRGHYLLSMDGLRDGEDIWGAKDANGHLFMQSVVEKALALEPGETDVERYPWQNEDDDTHR